jgi:hypothetical protein
MKTIVITFGHDRSWYPAGIARMQQSFRDNGYDGDFAAYNLESELGCPPHTEVPYAFKAYALSRAYTAGYDRVIWCDSSIKLIRPYSVVSERLDDKGYMLFNGRWNTGQWCSDAALETLKLDREAAFEIPHLMACCMGFDFPKCDAFVHEYHARAIDGTFKGAWSNENRQVSPDPRVLGHRHDQTAASVIATRCGMTEWIDHGVFYEDKPADVIPDEFIFTLRHGV